MKDTPASETGRWPVPGELGAKYLLMAAGVRAEPTGLIEIRWRNAGGGMDSAFFNRDDVDGAVAHALAVGASADTFVGVGLRNRRSGRADAVDRVGLLWADCDTDEALDALAHYEPRPSFVVRSGGRTELGRPRVHAYWVLKAALSAERVKPSLRRLCRALGADPSCVDIARVLRVPGTLNFKSDPPEPVVLELPGPDGRTD